MAVSKKPLQNRLEIQGDILKVSLTSTHKLSITKAGETTTKQSSDSSSINIRKSEKPLISPVHFVKIKQPKKKINTANLSGKLNKRKMTQRCSIECNV